ncbi:AEC family transporter [Lactococcus fujiensis]|nr:AEC family transporter [Lactococcus fujiensis]
MTKIIVNAVSFLLTILLAFFLKKVGVLKQTDGERVSKIVIFSTLPATIIIALNGFKITSMVWILMSLGLLFNVFLIFMGYLLGRKRNAIERGLYMFNIGGYNLGNFAIPFVASFFAQAIPFIAMFDMGNSFMVAGTTQAIVETSSKQQKNGFDLRDPLRILLKSPPFVVYVCMVILALIHVKVPDFIIEPLSFIAKGNSFLSLFMIGLFMQVSFKKSGLATIGRVLFFRYTFAFLLALTVYFLFPFSHLVKMVLILILFTPISFLTTIQATQFGVDEGQAGFVSSLSMIISLILMSLIVILL